MKLFVMLFAVVCLVGCGGRGKWVKGGMSEAQESYSYILPSGRVCGIVETDSLAPGMWQAWHNGSNLGLWKSKENAQRKLELRCEWSW